MFGKRKLLASKPQPFKDSNPRPPESLNSSSGAPGTPICTPRDDFPPIQDYGLIGDCRSAALISREGSIDWLCWPRFDRPAIFAALLDPNVGGHWQIAPRQAHKIQRHYIPDTNLLQTQFETSSGTVVLTDLMPTDFGRAEKSRLHPDHEILRRVVCPAGEVELEISFFPRPNYGAERVRIIDAGKLGLRMEVGRGVYWLRSSIPLRLSSGAAFGRVTLRAGQALYFSFSYAEEAPAALTPLDPELLDGIIEASARWWREWARRSSYDGPYRRDVVRSALTLKLLSYAPSGAIIAAPTSSLPEHLGGRLNWDYRYCWLRDASLTVRAMLELGYWEEADDFMDWMLTATRLTQPELCVLYDLYGETAAAERELRHLSGYMDSRPVRIGNAARNQLQLDVYGEVVDAAAQYAFHGRPLDGEMQKALIGFGNYVVEHWRNPDEGIWEPRSGRQHHTHSRLLCWTALDRLISLRERGLLRRAPVERYKKEREMIRTQIHQRSWNPSLQTYVSTLDGNDLDASLLLISWYGFEEARSSRMGSTYRAILSQLGTTNGLLYRYRTNSPEGTFAICSFWEAEYLALGGGSLAQAHALFRRLLGYRSELGLYGEEIDARTGAALGNFPQAFTHIGLIGAALSILQREKGEQQLAHRPESATRQNSASEAVA